MSNIMEKKYFKVNELTCHRGHNGSVEFIDEKCMCVRNPEQMLSFLHTMKENHDKFKSFVKGSKDSINLEDAKLDLIESPMVVKKYTPRNSLFYDLILMNNLVIRENLSFDDKRELLKWVLIKLYGLKIEVINDNHKAEVIMKMRRFKVWSKHDNSFPQLHVLISIFEMLETTHSDIKPANVMSDNDDRSWLIDVDNVIQLVMTQRFEVDPNYYFFPPPVVPELEKRVVVDVEMAKALCS